MPLAERPPASPGRAGADVARSAVADIYGDDWSNTWAGQNSSAASASDLTLARKGGDPYGGERTRKDFTTPRAKRLLAGGVSPERAYEMVPDVEWAGGLTPAKAAAQGITTALPGQAGGGYASLGGGSMAGAYTGGVGSSAGAGTVGGYELPGSAAASQSLRDLQMGGLSGLQGLMTRDTTASRKAMEDAIYAGSAEGINTAADRARQTMLEGTFARGAGSSSILVELAARQQQEQSDALAKARREAFTQAGSEDRADLASLLGLSQGAFSSATAGLQGEANVALTNLARQQQADQFNRNLQFQGSENQLNRDAASSQLGQSLGLQYAQLGQQGSQFGQNLQFQGEQNQLSRDAAAASQQAAMEQALTLLSQQQGFAGEQNDASRALTQLLATQQQDFAGGQNQLNRNTDLERLLLTLSAQDQRAKDTLAASALGAGLTGGGQLLGPLLKAWGS